MDYPKQALGFMLKQNRLDQNLSLRALAERTGISAMYLRCRKWCAAAG